MIHGIHDIHIDTVIVAEKIVYLVIITFSIYFILLKAHYYIPIPQSIYLTVMNMILGIKVACGFLIIFYRFVAFERR